MLGTHLLALARSFFVVHIGVDIYQKHLLRGSWNSHRQKLSG